MTEARRQQLRCGEGLIAAEVGDRREDGMPHADQVLEDETLVATVEEALARRRPKSRTRGRRGTPAEVVLRLQWLQHVRHWSFHGWERPSDSELVVPALAAHEKKLACIPRLVAGDAAFYSAKNEAAAQERGGKRVCLPNRSTKSGGPAVRAASAFSNFGTDCGVAYIRATPECRGGSAWA